MSRKHSHYFRACPFAEVDVYRVLHLFAVTDPCLQHAVKKLLLAGGRGDKATAGWDSGRDVQEAIDTLQRWQEMRDEETQAGRQQWIDRPPLACPDLRPVEDDQ